MQHHPDSPKPCLPVRVLALRDKDYESLSRSASGGAFAVLARAMLARGGAVFGAELCEDNIVRITCVEDVSELWRLQGSKYVQCSPNGSFDHCRELLESGRDVLFSGTPCLVYALKSYLARKGLRACSGKLVTVDLVCHGVTSPELFRLYVAWLESKLKAVPGSLRYTFRSKNKPWGLYYYYYYTSAIDLKRKEAIGPYSDDPYYRAFLSGKYYRKSCYSCRFAQPERVGDITIGDYWGIENAHPDFYDARGVSLAMLNTPVGLRYFEEECADGCTWVESDLERASAENVNLLHPSRRAPEDEAAAAELYRAVASGDSDLIFGKFLRQRGIKGLLKDCLPHDWIECVRTLKNRFK